MSLLGEKAYAGVAWDGAEVVMILCITFGDCFNDLSLTSIKSSKLIV